MSEPGRRRRSRSLLLAAGIGVLAFNLRPAVTALGAVLDEAAADLGLSSTTAGVLTMLPLVCFAAVGVAAPGLARRFGIHAVLAGSMVLVVIASSVRAATGSSTIFTLATVVCLAGMATGNVLIPALVKAHFPRRIGPMTAAYTTILALGTMLPAALTVPIGNAFGGWRAGLATWALTAAVAAVGWVALAVRRSANPRGGPPDGAVPTVDQGGRVVCVVLARNRVAWALALFFGLQAMHAYTAFGWLAQIYKDAGVDQVTAGVLLAVLPVAGIPIALTVPMITTRLPDPWPLVVGCGLCYLGGYLGLLIAPGSAELLWVLLLGLGGGSFPLALTLIGLRARQAEVTAKLSGFVQSVGYLLAAAGPLTIGALYGATGGWTVPLGVLAALVIPQVAAGVVAARPRYVDDEPSTTLDPHARTVT